MGRELQRPLPIGGRGGVLLALLLAGVWAYLWLGLSVGGLVPGEGGLEVVRGFAARALSPAWSSEAAIVPEGTPPLLSLAAQAAWRTVVFAGAAMGLALVLGVVLGFFASSAWWAGDRAGRTRGEALLLSPGPAIYAVTRVVIAVMRSVHEILWAVLFLVAVGLNEVGAVLAIAIPYAGTLAKIFSELVDEAPRDAARALRGAGASGMQVYAFGLVARALPDMTAYAFYRFECALRSSAVLGFFGFETLGLYLRASFDSLAYGEVWTYLYVLIGLVVVFDVWSGAVRRRLHGGVDGTVPVRAGATVAELWRARPRSRFVRGSLIAFAVLLCGSWVIGNFDFADAFSARRGDNLARFLTDVRPYPLQGRDWDWGIALDWAAGILADGGWAAVVATVAISVLAIVIAAALGSLLALPAARTWATPEPWLPSGRQPSRGQEWAWRAVVAVTRLLLIGLRSLPEYLLAFLLVAMLGPTAWPVVLALALHNTGILGRLGAETVENAEVRPLAALRAAGARRSQVAAVGVFPATVSRLLLYFFYRWETCVREATVLGMLGVVSLGYLIADARTRMQHDKFVFLILLGALIVIAGDFVSALARRIVRGAA